MKEEKHIDVAGVIIVIILAALPFIVLAVIGAFV